MDMRVGPAGLEPKVADRLLDLLSTDDAFRELFVKDTKAALEVAGYIHQDARLPEPWPCLWPSSGQLASKQEIASARGKLTESVCSIHGQMCPFDAQHPMPQ